MDAARSEPLFSLQNAAMRVRDRRIFEGTSWTVNPGEHWVVIGPNGAGKTTLLNTIIGKIPIVAGHLKRPANLRVGAVGPEQQRSYLQNDANRQHLWSPVSSSYPATTGTGSGTSELITHLTDGFRITHLLNRPVQTFSTGEMKKVLLVAAVAGHPDLLLLDEPFDGLDPESREWFAQTLPELVGTGITLVLATHREDEIVFPISHFAALNEGRLVKTGHVNRSGGPMVPGLTPASWKERIQSLKPEPVSRPADLPSRRRVGKTLIEMKRVSIRYNSQTIIRELNWVMRQGENWCITGPNGCGKTTLLNLISGNNLQAYANNIRLFGRRRGSGESIWDIKSNIGYVTPHLQARYNTSITAREVIISGFYDSIGLYRYPTVSQETRFGELAEELGIEELGETLFDRLSSGERTLILIARAMVKQPKILILDEPCQGLDPGHRRTILNAVGKIGSASATDLIYVTHRTDEIPLCITHRLDLSG